LLIHRGPASSAVARPVEPANRPMSPIELLSLPPLAIFTVPAPLEPTAISLFEPIGRFDSRARRPARSHQPTSRRAG
jgi:hypothetical protein